MPREKQRESPDTPRLCAVPDCGRPAYARGFCQGHHRQMLTLGRVRPIRPYRKRSKETIKFGGLRLTPGCANTIQQKADGDGCSVAAAIAEILEQWHQRRRQRHEERG